MTEFTTPCPRERPLLPLILPAPRDGRFGLTWVETVRFDVRYVDNWSLRLNLPVLLRTIRALLGHRGGY